MLPIRVSIFSDDPFFREGLRQIIRPVRSFAVIDEPLRNGIDPNADVVLVDSRTEAVLDGCANLVGDKPLLIFLSVPNDALAIDALAVGARGIIRKQDAISDVVRAITVVTEGGVWAPRHVVVDAWLRERRGVPYSRAAAVEQRLTAREREVVRFVMAGMSNQQVAGRLAITTATVKAHLTHVFHKLAVNGRGELMAACHGTLSADPTGSPGRLPAHLRRLA